MSYRFQVTLVGDLPSKELAKELRDQRTWAMNTMMQELVVLLLESRWSVEDIRHLYSGD